MRRTSKYYELKWVVECRSTYVFFETIAAFDHEGVAKGYAKDCAKVNPEYQYRVLSRDGKGKWK